MEIQTENMKHEMQTGDIYLYTYIDCMRNGQNLRRENVLLHQVTILLNPMPIPSFEKPPHVRRFRLCKAADDVDQRPLTPLLWDTPFMPQISLQFFGFGCFKID